MTVDIRMICEHVTLPHTFNTRPASRDDARPYLCTDCAVTYRKKLSDDLSETYHSFRGFHETTQSAMEARGGGETEREA